jgi:hypothetical protein
MKAKIEKISAITLKVADMEASLRFYRNVLGMELLYGGPNAGFSSLRIAGAEFPIINLQQGRTAVRWGRVIHSGLISKRKDSNQKFPRTLVGESVISICTTRTVTSCRLRDRYDSSEASFTTLCSLAVHRITGRHEHFGNWVRPREHHDPARAVECL